MGRARDKTYTTSFLICVDMCVIISTRSSCVSHTHELRFDYPHSVQNISAHRSSSLFSLSFSTMILITMMMFITTTAGSFFQLNKTPTRVCAAATLNVNYNHRKRTTWHCTIASFCVCMFSYYYCVHETRSCGSRKEGNFKNTQFAQQRQPIEAIAHITRVWKRFFKSLLCIVKCAS